MSQRHGSHTRRIGGTPAPPVLVDRARAEAERQRLALCGMDPEDTELMRHRDELDARDRLDDMGGLNRWTGGEAA